MSEVQKITASGPLGTMSGSGYVIDIEELRLLQELREPTKR